MQLFFYRNPTTTFCNIGGNGNSSSSDLIPKAIFFKRRKR